MEKIPESAKIVIIGAGVMGLFTAWELAKRGKADVVIIEERSMCGAGATQKAAGGVRTQFTTAPNVGLSKYSLDFYKYKFAGEINPVFEYKSNGYLFVARSIDKLRALDESLELQKKLGVEAVRRVTPEEISAINGEVNLSDVLGGNYSNEDGFVDPGDIVYGLENSVRKSGIGIFTDTKAETVESSDDFNFTVKTVQGNIKAEKVLFATGAWSAKLLKTCGLDFPIEPYRRSLYISEPLPWYPKNSPFTFDVNTGVHLRPESGGVLFLEINPDEKPSFNEEPDWDWLEEIIPHLIHFVPRLADAGVIDAWAGLYDMSPDHSAILGALPGPKGRFIAAGFSGHGLMHAPAVGCSMAELISDGKTSTIDISKFRPERFDEGEPILEKAVF